MNTLKNIKLFALICSVILSGLIVALIIQVKFLRNQNLAYRNNITALTDSLATYQVIDSLNAIQVGSLQLKLSEYEKLRQENANLIKSLKSDKLQEIVSTKTHAETKIVTILKDSIVYKDTVKTINYTSKWTDLQGFISKDTIQININNREELVLVESFQRKKFLGLKLPIWPFGHKRKTLEIVSKNPNTIITGAEYIEVY